MPSVERAVYVRPVFADSDSSGPKLAERLAAARPEMRCSSCPATGRCLGARRSAPKGFRVSLQTVFIKYARPQNPHDPRRLDGSREFNVSSRRILCRGRSSQNLRCVCREFSVYPAPSSSTTMAYERAREAAHRAICTALRKRSSETVWRNRASGSLSD